MIWKNSGIIEVVNKKIENIESIIDLTALDIISKPDIKTLTRKQVHI